jgi:hypothetical protein
MKPIYLILLLLALAVSLTSQVTQFGQPEFSGPFYTPNTSGSIWTIVPMNGSLNSQNQRIRISTSATWINIIPTYSLVSHEGGWYYYQINISRTVNNTIYNRESQFSIVLQNIEDGEWYNVPGVFINDHLFQYGITQTNATIQTMINNAPNNSVISIPQSSYYGRVNISSRIGLTLQGDNLNNIKPSFIGTGYQSVINISNSPNTKIRNLNISNGSGLEGGGLAISNSSNVLIDNCNVYNNIARSYYSGGAMPGDSRGGAIYASTSSVYLYETILYGNNASIGGTVFMNGGSISVANSTIDQVDWSPTLSINGYNGYSHTYLNSIVEYPNDMGGVYNLCCLYNTNLQVGQFTGYGNFIANPMFVNPAAANYSLQRGSPCIGNGFNDLYWNPQGSTWNQDFLTIHDETQDIGAIAFNGDRYAKYSFSNDAQGNWMCFPVIDDVSIVNVGGTNYEADVMKAFFRQYLGYNSPMTSVSFRWYGPNGYDTYTHFPLTPITWHNMLGFLGYKAVFNQSSNMNTLHGYHIPYNANVQVPETYTEHWIGYFIPETQTPQFAFGTFLNELYYIQHKNWTMARVKPQRGSTWMTVLDSGQRSPTLSYGDMVIVKKFGSSPGYPEIDEFVWNRSGGTQQFVKEEPTYFSFTKEPDYTPIFVQMDSLSTAKEIAVMINDICYGAAVIENDLVMIQSYTSSISEGTEMQLVTWDGAKSQASPLIFNLYDSAADQFTPCSSLIKENTDFYYVKLGNNEQNGDTPEITPMRITNYPNPFNPTTTITYTVPKDGEVKLHIYNLKGQLVKTLVSESKKSGSYKITWNGEDQAGNKVSSGLYFTRFESNGKTLTNKMLILK